MLRVFRKSFLEPLSSWPSALTLVLSLALYWLTAWVVLEARDARIGWMVQVMSLFLVPAAVVLGLPLIGEEARSGTLLLELMKPVSRASYFTGRVLGRAFFTAAFALVLAVGLFLVARRTGTPMFTGTRWLLCMKALSLVSVVVSLAALAPLSSSRFGHLAYWCGFAFGTWQLARLLQVWDPGWIGGPLRVISGALWPVFFGAVPDAVQEAPLGPWYLARALVQWGWGIAVAYVIGLLGFARMEVGRYR